MSKVQRKIGTVFTIAMICVAMVTANGKPDSRKSNSHQSNSHHSIQSKLSPSIRKGTVLAEFTNPSEDAKPMCRMWFPDAGAGEDPDDLIEKQIFELADKGFGGVEVAMLADGVEYDNEEGRIYGWGTDNWIKVLKKVLKAAAKVPGGFQVDTTITAHWPPTLNTFDPNDEASNSEIQYSVTKISESDLGTTVNLDLPETNTDALKGNYKYFIFADTFVSATVAQVSAINVVEETSGGGNGGGATTTTYTDVYEFDYATLQDITAQVTSYDRGDRAGVPDEATAEAYGWDYEDDIVAYFGPESDGPWVADNGKIDANGDRKRMADIQYQYDADLTEIDDVDFSLASAGDDIEVGDWVVISTFCRGTGQSIPNGYIMHNVPFVSNYFNEAGTTVLTDFWDNMMVRDPELLELMKRNDGYIFEDSIESSSSASYWALNFMDDVDDDYEYRDILPLVAASIHLSAGFSGTSKDTLFTFSGDDGIVDRIYEDYCDKTAELYVKYRVKGMSEWADSAFGWGFRGQTYQLPGLEISRASMLADVPETDNCAKGDGIRYQAGTVNITGRDFLTMEAITGPTIGFVTLDDVVTELGQNYSDGVTRAILHGTPYCKTFNDYNSDWPGWLPFGAGSFGSAYTYRQAYWDDVASETGYMARIQGVLQKGEAKIDLAVLIDKEMSYDFESGNAFQNLLDEGYSYNLVSESLLTYEDSYVAGGCLAPEGPAFKALIVDEVSIITVEAMEKLLQFAEAGLPVVVYNSDISRVYGSAIDDDELIQEMFAELLSLANVETADSTDEVKEALTDFGTVPYAQYSVSQLETTLYTDALDKANYYYMFNNAYPENSGMMGNDQASNYTGEDSIISNVEVTLAGEGVPYKLDPHTGDISQVGAYTVNRDGTVTFEVDELAGGDAVIYAVTNHRVYKGKDFYVTSVDQPADTYEIVRTDDGLALRSNTPGKYKATLFNHQKVTAEVETAFETIDLSDEDWNLVIHSYEPAGGHDPSGSDITTVDFGTQALGKWVDIPATAAQLAELGVDLMRNVSGTGEYTLTFTTPDGWSETTGAYLDVTYGKDQIGAITVNGVTIPANNASNQVDLGGLLVPGENTLTVKMSTSLYGRMYVENSSYEAAGADFGMSSGFMGSTDPDAYYNGLLSAVLTPYTQIKLSK